MVIATRGSITTVRGTLAAGPAAGPDSERLQGYDCFVRAQSGTVVLGGATVTATTGYRLLPSQSLGPINLDPGEVLCGIRAASGTTTVDVLTSTRD